MKAGTLEIEMITNVARLQKEMADMKRSVAGAMGDIADSASRADKALGSVGSGGLTRMGGSAKLASHHMQNLIFQLNDVVVGLFSGQKPMTVFMQQGSQIGQIGMQAGVGIGGMARALLGLAASAAATALTNPYLLAAAAAAALAFGAFKMFQSSVKQTGELDKYAQSLGLTKKEMEKLGPVGITVGDTMKGLWKTVSDGLSLGSVFSTLKDWAVTAFDAVMQAGKYAIAFIYAGWVGGFGAIKILWATLPGVIGEAAVGAANLAISGVEFMANKAIAAINWMIDRVNPLLDRVGLSTISRVESVALPRMENSFAGSTARMASQIKSEFSTAFGDAISMMDAFSAKWRENSIAAAKARLAAKAKEIQGDKTDKAAKNPKTTEAEKALKAAQDFARNLELETANIGKTPIEIKRMEVAMAALKAPTDEARLAILQAGEAWEQATKAHAEKEFIKNSVAPLELQVAMLDKSTKAQALANLEAEKEQIVLERGAAAWERYKAAKTALIEHDFALKDQEQFLKSLEDMVSATETAARGMADAFGSVGGAIGGITVEIARFASAQAAAAKNVADAQREYGKTSFQYADARAAQASAEINHYGNLASAAKGFFEEGSDGYKAMLAAEKVFRAFELAIAIKNAAVKIGLIGVQTAAKVTSDTAMAASDTARAGVEQGNSIITTGVKAVEAVVNAIRSLPFPLNIAAGALTAGVIASLGVAISGAFGGSQKLAPTNDGTGTVFGDATAKSESIAKAIDHLRDVDTLTMRYSAAMLSSLKNIEANIGGLTNLIIRTNGADSSAVGVQTGYQPTGVTGLIAKGLDGVSSVLNKIPIIGGILGGVVGLVGKVFGALFGTKTSITGQGIYGRAQSMGSILTGGFDASYYTDIKKTKKFLGISMGSSYSTQYLAASAELERQFSLIFQGFYETISAAAGPLGLSLDQVQARLQGFVVNIGRIDLKGLTGQQIQEKLTAVFGAAADSLARYAVPGLEQFQKVGEGYFETLVRVASSIEAVTTSMALLGTSIEGLSLSAKMNLYDLFGSASDMSSAVGEYFSLYYTKAEQAAAQTAQMAKVFDSLGLQLPGSIAGFRALVEAQDLTTEAGRAAYVTLIQLAPAFADLVGAAQDAASAAAIADERLSLERQLLEVQGNTAALRALDLAQLDASNQALQQQIWALQDQQKAADEAAAAAEKLRSAWSQITDSLISEVARIRGTMDGGSKTYGQALAEFNAATLAARAGDQEAAKSLPGLSQTLLGAASDAATSAQDLARIQGQTAASLEQTVAIINAMAGLATDTTVVAASAAPTWWEQFASTQTATAGPAANDSATVLTDGLAALKQELSDLRDEQRIASATIASGTSKTARILERVTPDGDALAVRSAA